jgi:hydroxypyruvate reductase
LIISDVLGDPLDVIASGPTVHDTSHPRAALEVLKRFGLLDDSRISGAVQFLNDRRLADATPPVPVCRVTNLVIGNNATAVDAAGQEAVRRGYRPVLISADRPEGSAEAVAAHLADMVPRMQSQSEPDCLISGGEPTVKLADESERGLGGRNQQLVLAAWAKLKEHLRGVVFLSGGTDGEDGPTDAAGAIIDERIAAAARQLGLDGHDFLARNDAYHFFEPIGGLIKTGPTDTNVCDVRVVVVDSAPARTHR